MTSFSYLTIARAISVRLLFTCHGLVAIWRLNYVTHDNRFWYLATAFGCLLLETSVTIIKNGGREWKWFCPSVFIYLVSTVPSIWFLELHELEKRMNAILAMSNRSSTYIIPNNAFEDLEHLEDLSANLGSVLGVHLEIRIPIMMSPDQWIRTLEQLLLLVLILGRWLLPKGKLTHDQLSQLLLVYIGTAADIVEFFEAFKEQEVRYNKLLCIIILGLWSLSLIQFTLVLTAARARRDQSGLVTDGPKQKKGCCAADVYGILISILLQDLPFLVLRLLLIFKYRVLSYTNMFFTSKNTLVIILLIYRLVVVYVERRKKHSKDIEETIFMSTNPRYGMSRSQSVTTTQRPTCNGSYAMSPSEENLLLAKTLPRTNNKGINTRPRIYKLRQEFHDGGYDYHFEQIDTKV